MDFLHRFLDALGRAPGGLWRALVRARVVLLVSVLVLGAVGLSLLSLSRDETDGAGDRPGSLVVDEHPADALAPRTRPTEYRVLYDVDDVQEEVAVRRPFSGRVEGPAGVTVSVLGQLGVTDRDGGSRTLNIPPESAVGDVRVEVGSHERRERRRITALDRPCDVYRVNGGDALLVDACVDANGMVLERVELRGGAVTARRLATELDLNPAFPAGFFDLPDVEPATPDQGGGATLPAAEGTDSSLATHELRRAPEGLRFHGRFDVVPPRDDAFTDILEPRRTAVVDVWEDGQDFLALEQGQTAGRTPAFDRVADARTVDVGALGEATVVERDASTNLVIARDDGRYVRVYGSVDVERLVEVARALRPIP